MAEVHVPCLSRATPDVVCDWHKISSGIRDNFEWYLGFAELSLTFYKNSCLILTQQIYVRACLNS